MFANYRIEDIRHKMNVMKIRPLDVMVTGVTGAGKSTTLNALFGKQVAKVGDGVAKDKIHAKKIVDLLRKTYEVDGKAYGWIDLVLVIIEGINRDMGSTYKLLNEVVIPNFQRERILMAINQADVAMKGRHWNNSSNRPDATPENFLRSQVDSVMRRVREVLR